MKRLGYIILGVCLFLTGCKDSPRNHEEIKEDAIEFVQDFIEDAYKGKDVSDKCLITLTACRMIDEIEQEFEIPYRLQDVLKVANVKIDPKKV